MSKLTTKLIMLAVTCGVMVAAFGTAAGASHTDLEPVITKTYSPQPAIAGEPVTFSLTVTNEGHSTATDTLVVDDPEGNPSLVSSTATLADGTQRTDACFFNTDPGVGAEQYMCPALGPLGPGETITVDLTLVYPEPGTFQNEASVSLSYIPPAGTPPPTYELGRNLDTISVEVMAMPTTKAQCKKGGYAEFGFASQKECMAFVRARA
jgi:uncharacterized repeat protein (TIGR01451 family)